MGRDPDGEVFLSNAWNAVHMTFALASSSCKTVSAVTVRITQALKSGNGQLHKAGRPEHLNNRMPLTRQQLQEPSRA
jgi:hypothetical protein